MTVPGAAGGIIVSGIIVKVCHLSKLTELQTVEIILTNTEHLTRQNVPVPSDAGAE